MKHRKSIGCVTAYRSANMETRVENRLQLSVFIMLPGRSCRERHERGTGAVSRTCGRATSSLDVH